ncbi:hypothetical protein [Acinetobacter shaoyimingii]|uniref:Uncharacterized protein n=1 Tax=Acinetobacter shaoyimingii TaxID=2715164 RepID=A0A6G8RYM2_9GAMM|nr:hypothetical protein [Acinetobacter shaoyimingii]QIO06833.1 hypothetical protein G8E00_13230 [Acinetobacter shaoyimingii]
MNTRSKIALITASVLSAGALTACQTTSTPNDAKGPHKFDGSRHERQMTPEQREQFKKHLEQRKAFAEQFKKACEGKAVGQTTQIKVGEKTIDGTCVSHFKVDRKDMKQVRDGHHPMKGEHRPMKGDFHKGPQQNREPLTDAKRAELTQKFDARLAKLQQRQQAIAQACQGQKVGQTVQIKVGEKTLNGQCQVRFQPNAIVAPTAVKAS